MSIRTRTKRVLFLTERAQDTIVAAAARAHPIETGGILVGVRTRKRPWAVMAIEVDTDVRGHTTFLIPEGATQSEVDRSREADARLGYLGDWHVHPADIGASPTDISTLRRLGAEVGGPVVSVVARRGAGQQHELEAWLFRRRRIHPVEIILTGPLR